MPPSPNIAEFQVNRAYLMLPHEFSGFSERFEHGFSLRYMSFCLLFVLFSTKNHAKNAKQHRSQTNGGPRLNHCLGFHSRHDDFTVAIALEQLPPAILERFFHASASHKGIPVHVVIKVAGEIAPADDWALEQRFLQRFEPAVIDHFLPAGGKGVFLDEMPGLLLVDIIADDFDLGWVG